MVPQRPAGEPDRVHGGHQVPAHQGQVAGLDRDVGARCPSPGRGRPAPARRRRSRRRRPSPRPGPRPAAARSRRPCPAGSTSATTRSMPTWAATARAAASLSPVSSTGVRPSSTSRRMASAEVGFTVSATVSTARAGAVPADQHRACGPAPRRRPGPRRARRSRCRPQSARKRSRPATTACPSTTPCTPSPAVEVNSSTAGSVAGLAGGGGDGGGDRVLAGRPPAPRPGAAPRPRWCPRPRRRRAATSSRW